MNEKSFACLIQVLEKCRRWGYTEVWFNHDNPHWTHSQCWGMIIAAPKHGGGNRFSGSLPLWGLGYDPLEREVIGSLGCGNALAQADQGQWDSVAANIPRSYYKLVDGQWLTKGELE